MKLTLKTSNKTITEKLERYDKHLCKDARRGAVIDILLAALASNGELICGDSDVKWELFEMRVLASLRRFRKNIK